MIEFATENHGFSDFERQHPTIEIILAAERLALAPRPKAAAPKLNAPRAKVKFRVGDHQEKFTMV